MAKWSEIGRFNASGKTFFFNEAKTKSGEAYLQINALSRNKDGGTVREKLSVFDVHLLPFYMKLKTALEHFVGSQVPDKDRDVLSSVLCISCGAPKKYWSYGFKAELPKLWIVFCGKCRSVLVENEPGAGEKIRNAEGSFEYARSCVPDES